MYDEAIMGAVSCAVIAIGFGFQAYKKRDRADFAFTLFGVFAGLRFANLYVWLNLGASSELYPILRGLDFFLVMPMFVVGLEMLRSNLLAKSKNVSKWVRGLTYIVPSILSLIMALFMLIFDPRLVRVAALVVISPFVFLIIGYYGYLLKDNPLRHTKPEFARGAAMVISGYLIWAFGEAVIAGVFRLLEWAIRFQIAGVFLAAAGGVVQGVVTFTGLYSKLRTSIVLVNDAMEVEMNTLGGDVQVPGMNGGSIDDARELVSRFQDDISNVLRTGETITNSYLSLDFLEKDRTYRVDLLPHQLDSTGKPISVILAISDVTRLADEKETEQLAELLDHMLEERNRAEFYLDLLGHDMNNLLQGILLAMELLQYNQKFEPEDEEILSSAKGELQRSIDLVQDAKLMAETKEGEVITEDMNLLTLVKRASKTVRSRFPDQEIHFEIKFPKSNMMISAEPVFEQAIAGLIGQCVISQRPGDIEIFVEAKRRKDSLVQLEIGPYATEMDEEVKDKAFEFEMKSRIPRAGVGFALAKELVGRINGNIIIEQCDSQMGRSGLEFLLELPSSFHRE